MPVIIGFTIVTIFSTDPPNSGIIIFSMAPSGLLESSSSLVASMESTLGPSKALVIIPFTSTCWITRFPLSCRYRFMCPSSKNEVIITSLMVSRIERNCLGITPLPYRNGIRSNSILTASQLVTPPANPNRPKARTKFHFRNSGSSTTTSRTIPSTMITKVSTLLQSPEARQLLGFFGLPWKRSVSRAAAAPPPLAGAGPGPGASSCGTQGRQASPASASAVGSACGAALPEAIAEYNSNYLSHGL
mmetsp:Transcript_65393/g.149837  ORF Transcript_65393/g.149837 Transcript_65393/m.149837 type:complete len:246 (-) Transcript_65393:8-745(-)